MWVCQSAQVVDILTSQPVTMNNHGRGVSPANFAVNAKLSSTLMALSTNVDRNGLPFVSTVEGRNGLPMYVSCAHSSQHFRLFPPSLQAWRHSYGTQWHPEKPQFEWWLREVVNHTPDSITANSYFARFLGTEARRNSHGYSNFTEEQEALIYNWIPRFTAAEVPDFETCYFFE